MRVVRFLRWEDRHCSEGECLLGFRPDSGLGVGLRPPPCLKDALEDAPDEAVGMVRVLG